MVQEREVMQFKASNGWFMNFCKRSKIKFRRRKCGKRLSTDECIDTLNEFYSKLRHEILSRREGEECEDFSTKWGRFPPERCYSMDEVPLPFVVSQDSTFKVADDDEVQVAGCGKGDLRKR